MQTNILPILLFSSFFLPLGAWSQDPFYINYDTNDGLPSSETYFAHADTNGLIWIATDRGVCAYDGYQFHTYTTNEGLSHNTNFRIFSDRKNRLWFTAWDGSVSVYEDGQFKAIPLHEDTIYGEYFGHANQLLFDEQNNAYITKRHYVDPKKVVNLFRMDTQDFSISREAVLDFENCVWKIEEQGIFLFEIGGKHLLFDERKQFSVHVELLDTLTSSWFAGFEYNHAVHFSNSELKPFYQLLKTRVHNFFLDPHKNLWLCTPDGLLCYEDAQVDQPPRHFFKGLDVTCILMDREGSYWMTSREKGIFWIPSFQFHSLLRPTGDFEIRRTLSVGELPNHLLFGTVSDGIVAVDKQFHLSPQSEKWRAILETKRIYPSANTIYLTNFFWIKELDGELKNAVGMSPMVNTPFVKELKNGLFLHTNNSLNGGYHIYSENKLNPIFSSFESNVDKSKNKEGKIAHFRVRVNCVEEANDLLWLGGLDGLYQIPLDKLLSDIPHKDVSEIMDVRIEDIISIDSQSLWVATIGNGLVYKNGAQHVQLSQEDGMSSNLVNKIFLENDSTLWAGTNKGLDKVRFRQEGNSVKVQAISNFSTADGLISNFINDLTIWEDRLWLATNKGINYFFPEEMVENTTAPLIRIEEILVGDCSIKGQTDCQLNHSENDLTFNFSGISFKKPRNKKFYRYRLIPNKGKDQDKAVWYYTDNRSIRFLDLAPGHYTFEVAAQNKSGNWSQQMARYSFNIKAHFSDQLWFRIIAGFLLALLIGLGFYYRILMIQAREEQKRKLQGAELNVLRNQMNPHFIFNSLNSIQSFIFYQDVKKASHFLSKFSRLMRNSLEYSRLEYISVEEEINFVQSYLDLEKLRFDDRFEVRIKVAPEIPVHHYFIPPLLLQPVLENSVKHAFKNISYQGRLDIQFSSMAEEKLIQIIICDNGRGFQESKDLSSGVVHQSMGLSIIENRIKLLNQNNNVPRASFKFSNRYNARQEVIGTQAHFRIPIQIKKND